MKKGRISAGLVALVALMILAGLLWTAMKRARIEVATSEEIVNNTWAGYKHYFIDEDGRVRRPKDRDTVSEGQAYAMLRAVWMDDKEVFDRCYRWTEENLSRKDRTGDNLLAWHWKGGRAADRMPASDADIDYALALILADSKWPGMAPDGTEDYGEKAERVLSDVLRLETYTTAGGRLYLSPWIPEEKEGMSRFPVNPSYYSPAHFRIFYAFTKDERWLALKDTAYYVLNTLARYFNGAKGAGLVPDWCSVDRGDRFYPLEGKNQGFGWEAVRVPLRVAMDYFWFESEEAKGFLRSGFAAFAEKKWLKDGRVYSEYNYDGTSGNKYENPLFYASYATALIVSESEYSDDLLEKSRGYIKKYGDMWIYMGPGEYYVNSLAWFPEGFTSKKIKKRD
jgi:endoglucanase